MSEDDATIALTYEQVAQRLGIEVASAKARARRGNWRRVPGNDGKTVVFVPRDALETEKPKTAETETPQPSLLVGELLRRVATRYDQTADSFLGFAALDVWSQALMVHSCRLNGGMRYGPSSPWERHHDRGGPSSDTA